MAASDSTDPGAVLVTGAAGRIGRKVCDSLRAAGREVVGLDIATPGPGDPWQRMDIRDPALSAVVIDRSVSAVVHLAAVVGTPDGMTDADVADIEIGGTRNLLAACEAGGVATLVVSSSGAAYGYHADNPALLTEDDPVRGNPEFPYADHKREIEVLLAAAQERLPGLRQVILRLCTVLGPGLRSPVTALFERRVVLGLSDAATPFCFAWDQDVADCVVRAVEPGAQVCGPINVAGDGAMTLREIAAALGRPFLPVPSEVLRRGLGWLKRRGLAPYGPEQVMFIEHRPVLGNHRLKEAFPGLPTRTSHQAFEDWRASHA